MYIMHAFKLHSKSNIPQFKLVSNFIFNFNFSMVCLSIDLTHFQLQQDAKQLSFFNHNKTARDRQVTLSPSFILSPSPTELFAKYVYVCILWGTVVHTQFKSLRSVNFNVIASQTEFKWKKSQKGRGRGSINQSF